MKNLITKNVILRFKLGQKILRFLGGGLTYHGQKVRPVYDNSVGSRDMYYIPGIELKISRAQLDKGLTEKNSFTSGRQYFKGADGNLYNDKGLKITIKSKPVSLIGKKTDISKARGYKTRSGETNYAVRIGGKWYYTNNKGIILNEMPNNYISADGLFNFNNGKFSWNIPEKEETNPKTPLRTPVKDPNRYISTLGNIDAYKNSLTTEGLADRDTVKAFLLKLIDAGLLEKNGADGIWGKNTEAAYQAMLAKNKEPIPTLTLPVLLYIPSLGYRTNFDYTGPNSNIRDLGFNDYTTMVNFINNNPDNLFSRDMIKRFGNTNTWNLNNVESALNVSGKYRPGRGGNFSDIMKSQADWAGTENGNYDRRQNFWNNLKAINGRLFFKQGGLISKNPVKRFKSNFNECGTTTTLKNGGNVPKLQTAWSPITLLQQIDKQQELAKDFSNKAINNVKSSVKKFNKKNNLYKKADLRANKNTRIPMASDNTAKLLDALYNIGAFDGLKDRHGRDIIYDTAVDGINGNVTKQAIENARKSGYIVDVNSGKVLKLFVEQLPNYNSQLKNIDLSKVNLKKPSGLSKNNTPSVLEEIKSGISSIFMPNDKNNYVYSKPYNYNIDVDYKHPTDNGYLSRLGNLGLEAKNGYYILKDDKGNVIDLCALTVNALERMLGKHQNTDGNAWSSKGLYGDSMLVNGYKYLPKMGKYNSTVHTLHNLAAATAVLTLLPNLDLLTGDVVGLYSMNSAHNDEAWLQGTRNRSNSHEGMVFSPSGRRDETYIIHNVNGKIKVDPMNKFMVQSAGVGMDWAPTYVMRPKSAPQKSKEPDALTYKGSIDGTNFYDFLTNAGKKKYGIDIHDSRNYVLENGNPKLYL